MKRACLTALLRDGRGTATVEFVVLLVCIAVAFIVAWRVFAEQIVTIIAGE